MPKKTPRILRRCAQTRVVGEKESGDTPLIPGMSLYGDDIGMDAGNAEFSGSLSVSTDVASKKKLSQEADIESAASESEESSFR